MHLPCVTIFHAEQAFGRKGIDWLVELTDRIQAEAEDPGVRKYLSKKALHDALLAITVVSLLGMQAPELYFA